MSVVGLSAPTGTLWRHIEDGRILRLMESGVVDRIFPIPEPPSMMGLTKMSLETMLRFEQSGRWRRTEGYP